VIEPVPEPTVNVTVIDEPSHATIPADEILDSLQLLLQRFDQLDGRLDDWSMRPFTEPSDAPASYEPISQEDLLHLQSTLDEAWRANEELRHQNEQLAAQLAQSNVQKTVRSASGGSDESLSWEERKALMMRQMEDDTFDADAFVSALATVTHTHGKESSTPPTPIEFVDSLIQRIELAEQTIRNRDDEIGELKMLLANQSNTRNNGTAIGAAAIASMIDTDELVMEERARLQQLKNDWEDKFRQSEIEASLERAKLSRERQEIAKRQQELEDQLAELQREKRDTPTPAKTGRRWLTELGLGNADAT
jgi:myosin heavy subunit